MRAVVHLVVLVLALGACSTRAFFFHPNKNVTLAPDASRYTVEPVTFPSTDGHALRGWILAPLSAAPSGVVVHLHGNGGNIGTQYTAVLPLVDAGFEALVFDYQGYGTSEGEPSQEGVLDDATAALAFARARPEVAGRPLILFGQSLGGHLAIVAASRSSVRVDAVVSEGAFTSYEDIAVETTPSLPGFVTRLVVPERYAAIEAIGELTMPVLVIHSTDDEVIPYAMGVRLYARAREPKQLWTVDGPHIATRRLHGEEMATRVLALVGLAPR